MLEQDRMTPVPPVSRDWLARPIEMVMHQEFFLHSEAPAAPAHLFNTVASVGGRRMTNLGFPRRAPARLCCLFVVLAGWLSPQNAFAGAGSVIGTQPGPT